jgi:diguanylate cyclase (GGDEF)-like protein
MPAPGDPTSASPASAGGVSESERLIRHLYRITSDTRTRHEQKIEQLLMLGCERFGLDIGIVAEISEGTFSIRHFRAPGDMPLERGLGLDLEHTFGGVALDAGEPVAMARIEGAYADHPAVRRFDLRAYIGCPIRIGDDVWGTLSFSGRQARTQPFRAADVDAVQLMATWIGAEIQRQQSTDELRRLNGILLRYKDALEAANRQLREQNRLDELTGIANRRTVMEDLRTLLVRASRKTAPLTVIAIDADNFKKINDAHGHAAGDSTLKRIARVLVDLTRDGDLVGRLGGEEFLVALPDTDVIAALPLAERLREGVQAIRGLPMRPSISLGIAGYRHGGSGPIHIERVLKELLVHADQAMYRAKHEGKNRVCVAGD